MNLTQCIKAGSHEERPGWLIKFDYDLKAIQSLKESVPYTEREWRPDTYEWWVSESYNDVLKKLFGNFEAMVFLQGRLF